MTSSPPLDDFPEPHVSRRSYLVVGGICLAASVPSWFLLLTGRLFTDRDPFLLLPFAGVPAGILLLLFGRDRFRRIPLSDHGFRLALLALAVSGCFLGSWIGVRLGAEGLLTAKRFCGMAASYLALVSFGLLTAAALRGKTHP